MKQPVQVVRYGELKPCKTAFIDAHTPGSDQKKTSPLLVEVFLSLQISMSTLQMPSALTLVPPVSPQMQQFPSHAPNR